MSRARYYYYMFEARALQGVNLVTFSDMLKVITAIARLANCKKKS